MQSKPQKRSTAIMIVQGILLSAAIIAFIWIVCEIAAFIDDRYGTGAEIREYEAIMEKMFPSS